MSRHILNVVPAKAGTHTLRTGDAEGVSYSGNERDQS